MPPLRSGGDDDSVLYRVLHETRYDYESSVELAHHLAQLRPLSLPGLQQCEAYQCDIEPRPEHLARDLDAYGNERLFFAHYAPHDTLRVRALSRVRVRAPAQPDWAASPAWEQVRGLLRYRAGRPNVAAAEFSFGSEFSPVFDQAAAFAAQSFTRGRALLDAAHDLMRRIHAEFTYDPDSTEVHTRAPQALELRHGVCQDYAHVMLSALRSLGLAARYMSGYLRSRPRPGEQALVGADASHAWVSVWCPSNGWVEFDPTNDRRPEADYVRVAVGRDFADVSPLRGVIRGGGRHALQVAVNVSPAGSDTI